MLPQSSSTIEEKKNQTFKTILVAQASDSSYSRD